MIDVGAFIEQLYYTYIHQELTLLSALCNWTWTLTGPQLPPDIHQTCYLTRAELQTYISVFFFLHLSLHR